MACINHPAQGSMDRAKRSAVCATNAHLVIVRQTCAICLGTSLMNIIEGRQKQLWVCWCALIHKTTVRRPNNASSFGETARAHSIGIKCDAVEDGEDERHNIPCRQ